MNVMELIAAPKSDTPNSQPGYARPPTKYCSVVPVRRRKYQPMPAMPTK